MSSNQNQLDKANDTTPRIYVACLSAYNNGLLHGRWIDAIQDVDAIRDDIQAMLAESPEPGAEEHAIHDYDNFAGIRLGEYEDLATVADLAQLVAEHGELARVAYDHGGSADGARRLIEEQYHGCWCSLADWAEDLLLQTGQLAALPDNLRCYFDHDAYARESELNGDIFTVQLDGDVHVFWSR